MRRFFQGFSKAESPKFQCPYGEEKYQRPEGMDLSELSTEPSGACAQVGYWSVDRDPYNGVGVL